MKKNTFEFDIRMHEPTEKLLKHIGFKFNGTAWILFRYPRIIFDHSKK